MLRFTRFTKNFSRPFVGLFTVLLVCFALIFADSTAGAQNSRSKSKPSPTPKKNAKATPSPKKKTQSKAAPTPKKSTKEKTASSNKNSDKNKQSSSKSNSKNSAKNTKDTKKSSAGASKTNAKNSKDEKSSSGRNSSRKDSSRNSSSKNKTNAARETRTTTGSASKSASKKTTPTRTASSKTAEKNNGETTADPRSEQPQIIVTDVSARLRNQAKSSAAEVSRVKLGTILRVTEKNPAWYRVQYSTGGKTSNGWISANSVNDLNAGAREEIYRQIVERNYKTEMDFATAAELIDFMTRVNGEMEKSDAAAEMELKRLMLMRETLRKIPAGQSAQSPYREFLKSHEKSVVYSEPAGEWLVASNQFWDLHKKYQTAKISDRIAWEGSQNSLPGECEGYVNCHLFYLRMTHGEYLRLHPTGARATDALKDLTAFLEPIVADSTQKQVYQGPTDVTDRAEFNNLIAELRTIVSRLSMTEKDKPLQQLRQIAEAFR